MKSNMGKADKLVRTIIAVVSAVFYANGTISGTLGLLLVVLATIFLLTSMISFCPIYSIFKINTRHLGE